MEILSKPAAPQEMNGRCNSGVDEGATNAKRIKLASVLDTILPPHSETNGTNAATPAAETKRKGATVGPIENVNKVAAANGHSAAVEEMRVLRRNQDGEVSDGHVTTEYWKEKWERGKTKFHKKQVHGMLTKYYPRIAEGKRGLRFLIPLCGKSVDMVWLLEQGCSVVGCEIVELGVKHFFAENNIEHTTTTLAGTGGKVYKGTDKDITVYVMDFFTLSSKVAGRFDCIWDRGSLAAINPDDRERYRDVITDLLKPESRYLLDIFEVPHDVFSGPPHNLDPDELDRLYGEKCNIELLEHVDAMNPWSKTWGITYFYENDFLLSPKKLSEVN